MSKKIGGCLQWMNNMREKIKEYINKHKALIIDIFALVFSIVAIIVSCNADNKANNYAATSAAEAVRANAFAGTAVAQTDRANNLAGTNVAQADQNNRTAETAVAHANKSNFLAATALVQEKESNYIAETALVQVDKSNYLAETANAKSDEANDLAATSVAQAKEANHFAETAVAQADESNRLAKTAVAQAEEANRLTEESVEQGRESFETQYEANVEVKYHIAASLDWQADEDKAFLGSKLTANPVKTDYWLAQEKESDDSDKQYLFIMIINNGPGLTKRIEFVNPEWIPKTSASIPEGWLNPSEAGNLPSGSFHALLVDVRSLQELSSLPLLTPIPTSDNNNPFGGLVTPKSTFKDTSLEYWHFEKISLNVNYQDQSSDDLKSFGNGEPIVLSPNPDITTVRPAEVEP